MGGEVFSNFLPDEASVLRELLWKRGFRDSAEAKAWLDPVLSDLPIPDHRFKDLDLAIRHLLRARDRKDLLIIYGDYDVDGSTATALLYRFLSELGWQVDYFIPRRLQEGYGLSVLGAERLLAKFPRVKWVLTVDCGISSAEGVDFLRSKEVSVIVTDHHNPPEKRVDAVAVLNPKQKDCGFPAKDLAGVGVAFFLAVALRKALEAKDYRLRPLLSYVALGSLCDMVPMSSDNRVLLRYGLAELSQSSDAGLKALKQVCGMTDRPLRSEDCGFQLGPRINAVGRVGDPQLATDLLVESNPSSALRIAQDLDRLNLERRALQKEQVEWAIEKVKAYSKEAALVVHDEGFHLGIVGLIASALTRQEQKVSCVFAPQDDEHALADLPKASERVWKASLRSLKGFHLAKSLELLRKHEPDLLINSGGHSMAAGLSLYESKLDRFRELFTQLVEKAQFEKVEEAAELELSSAEALDSLLDRLEPFGPGWEKPKFLVRDFIIHDLRWLKQRHLKLFGAWQGRNWSLLQFNSPWASLEGSLTDLPSSSIQFVGELTENFWGGRKQLEFIVYEWMKAEDAVNEYRNSNQQREKPLV